MTSSNTALTISLLLATTTTRSLAFTPPTTTCSNRPSSLVATTTALFDSDGSGGGGLSRAYNDNALFQFHQRTQDEKISGYEGSSTYINTDALWNLAWHDSFVRNDLSDFVPPLTDNLHVLTIGDELDSSSNSINGGDGAAAGNDLFSSSNNSGAAGAGASATDSQPTAALEGEDTDNDDGDDDEKVDETASTEKPAINAATTTSSQNNNNNNNPFGFLGNLLNMNRPKEEDNSPKTSAIELVTYDCILDKGLMSQLLIAKQEESCTQLLLEATKKIREHGVYVLQSQPLDDATKTYLQDLGDVLGLQWQFELDGISDDVSAVSVARKYFVGELPTMGKLATVGKEQQ